MLCNREGGLKIASKSGDLPSIFFKQIFVRKDFGDYWKLQELLFSFLSSYLFSLEKIKEDRSFLFLRTAILSLLIPLYAFAQSDSSFSTDEIEVTSLRSEVSIYSSASNISILNKASINRRNGDALADILKSVNGVFIKSYGNSSALQTISMNGLGAEHTVILLNGSKLNSLQNGQIDLSLIPVENISRIEVMNNGYSSLYGSEAMGGVVNIITDEMNSANKLNLKLSSGFGQYNARKYSFRVDNRISKLNWGFLFSDERADNNYEFYFDSGIEKELRNKTHNAYKVSNYVFESQYNFNENYSLKYYAQFVNSDKEIPGIETGITPPDTKQFDKNWNNILQFNFAKKNLAVFSDFNFQNNLQNYTTQPILKSYYKNILFSNISRVEFTKDANSYIFGGEIKYGTLNSNELKDDIDRKHYALFNSSKLKFNNLLLFPSIRYDYITDIKKGAATYRIGANYQPISKINFHIRANISRNFGVPTFNGLYWKTGGNPDLKPEYSQNYEAGLILNQKSFLDFTFDFAYLNIQAEDRIVWLPGRNFIWSPKNIGKTKSEIFISSVRLQRSLLKNIYLKGELSYTNNYSKKANEDFAGDPSFDKQIIYIPDEQVKSNLEVNFGIGGINLFHSYIGKRYSDSENLNQLSPINILDGNVFFNYKISNYIASIKFEVNNITNSDYQIIAGYPAPLRNYNFKINLNYSL